MAGLVDGCLAHAPVDGVNPTAIEGLVIYRRDDVAEPVAAVYRPSIILVAQGVKQARVGEERFVYDPDHYLVTAVPLPLRSEVVEARPERPFLSLAIDVDLEAVRRLVAQAGDAFGPLPLGSPQRGLASCPVTPAIRDLTERLVGLLDRPTDIAVLGPLYRQELLYHVLQGPRGGFLRAAAMGNGQQRAVAEVLAAIHADCARSFTVGELATMAGMSETVFYEAFKTVTAATPMQYIKRLRLQEAHRLLTLGTRNVSGAAYEVGYNSLSQFSREFTRVFGANPSSYLRP